MKLRMNGDVVADSDLPLYDYFGLPCIAPARVRQALMDNPAGETLTLEINSCGGSALAGFEIYTLLQAAHCETVAEVQSLAASAASVIAAGATRTLISPVGQIMVHLPRTIAEGSQEDMRRAKQRLEAATECILNAYERKSGGRRTRSQLRAMMEREAWLTPAEALDAGLADGMLFAPDSAAAQALDQIAASLAPVSAAGRLEHMREAWRAAQTAHTASQWDRTAAQRAVTTEKLRYGGI